MFTSENAPNILFPVAIQSALLTLFCERTACTQTGKELRGKVVRVNAFTKKERHENDKITVHFNYILYISPNLKTLHYREFHTLVFDKGQIEFTCKIYMDEPEKAYWNKDSIK